MPHPEDAPPDMPSAAPRGPGAARRPPRWDVVATVREPLPLILAFATHHLALGANALWLYFDDPEDPALETCAKLTRTHVCACDDAHWLRLAGKPVDAKVVRQRINATHAVGNSAADWVFNLDADEFLWARRPVAETLGAVRRGVDWIKLRNLERVWLADTPDRTVFDGAFRLPARGQAREVLPKVYGEDTRFLDHGLGAHQWGKPVFRAGLTGKLMIHSARRAGSPEVAPYRTASDLYLLHFDGLTPLHWAAKILRYHQQMPSRPLQAVHDTRLAQIEHVLAHCATLRDVAVFHARLFRLSPDQQARLEAAKLLLRPDVDCAAALAAVSAEHHADLAPERYDRILADRFAAHLAALPAA